MIVDDPARGGLHRGRERRGGQGDILIDERCQLGRLESTEVGVQQEEQFRLPPIEVPQVMGQDPEILLLAAQESRGRMLAR